jgi:hypothetical protein
VISFQFGASGDTPIAGDWDLDGKDGIGVYRASTGTFLLKNKLEAGGPNFTIESLNWLIQGVGVAGDWNGDGLDTVGVLKNGVFYFTDVLCVVCRLPGNYVRITRFGRSGDLPVAGDWDGDGYSGIGVFRPSTGQFLLRNDATTTGDANLTLTFGAPGDRPMAGHWVNITGAPAPVAAPEIAPTFQP